MERFLYDYQTIIPVLLLHYQAAAGLVNCSAPAVYHLDADHLADPALPAVCFVAVFFEGASAVEVVSAAAGLVDSSVPADPVDSLVAAADAAVEVLFVEALSDFAVLH